MALFKGLLNDELDLVDLERLCDVIICAQFHRLDSGFGGGIGGDHDHDRLRGDLLDRLQYFDAVSAGIFTSLITRSNISFWTALTALPPVSAVTTS